jgi:hypothetical protein
VKGGLGEHDGYIKHVHVLASSKILLSFNRYAWLIYWVLIETNHNYIIRGSSKVTGIELYNPF